MRIGFVELVAALLAVLLLALILSMAWGAEPAPRGTIFMLCGAAPAAPVFADVDGDGLSDEWEILHFAGLEWSGAQDADGDGLNNRGEFLRGADPFVADTDGDGLADPADSRPAVFDNPGSGDPGLPAVEDALNRNGLVVFRP